MDILFPFQTQNNECFCCSPPLVLNLKKYLKILLLLASLTFYLL
jgi:hypothetical protein